MVPHTQLTQEGPKSPIQSIALGVVCKAGCRRAPHPARWSVYHTGGEVAVWTGIQSIELWRIIPTWTYEDELPLYVMYRALEILVGMFSNCRITFLGLLCCGSSDLASSRGAGGTGRLTAVKDTPCGWELYPWIGGYQDSKLLQKVIWRLFLVVYFKLMDF